MNNFNDKNIKPKFDRLLLRLTQIDNKTLSLWNVTDLISDFGEYYYKIDLIHSVVNALNSGINPKNIIIFDRSINFKYNSYVLTKLSLEFDLIDIYKLGSPVSLFPNKMINDFRIFFNLFGKVTKLLHDIQNHTILKTYDNPITLKYLQNVYKVYKSDEIYNLINEFVIASKSQVPENAEYAYELIINLEKEAIRQINRFSEKQSEIKRRANEIVQNKTLIPISEDEYFYHFFQTLDKIPRPIVGIYNNESEKINLLCSYHFDESEDNSFLLILDKITHKSPYLIDISAVGWIIAPIFSFWIGRLMNRKKDNMDKDLRCIELNYLKEEQIRKIYLLVQDLFNENLGKDLLFLETKYFQQNFNKSLSLIVSRFVESLKTYAFEIIDIEEKSFSNNI